MPEMLPGFSNYVAVPETAQLDLLPEDTSTLLLPLPGHACLCAQPPPHTASDPFTVLFPLLGSVLKTKRDTLFLLNYALGRTREADAPTASGKCSNAAQVFSGLENGDGDRAEGESMIPCYIGVLLKHTVSLEHLHLQRCRVPLVQPNIGG